MITSSHARLFAVAGVSLLAFALAACSGPAPTSSGEPSSSGGPAECAPKHPGLTTVAEGKLTVGTPNAMPYSEFVSETEAKGIDVDAVKQAAADECLTPVYKPLTNNSIAMVSQQREADIIVGGWYVTEERAKQVAFTSPLWYDAMGIISKEGYNTIAQLETAGKICSGTGFSFNDTIKKLVGDNYAEYPTQIEIKADLDNGRCQVALDGYAIGVDIYGDSYKVEVAQPDDRVPITTTQPMIALLMSKENPELQTAISEDIDSYRADGQLKNWNAAAGLADSLVIPAAAAATSIR